MSNKGKTSGFSSDTASLDGDPSNPAVFPVIMMGTAMFFGIPLYLGGVEGRLASLLGNDLPAAASFYTTLGALSITAAHGFAMQMNGNARKEYKVAHPKSSNEVGYLNAGRGYYNMVEHMPFFFFNFYLCAQTSPCIAGSAAIVWGIGRILYTSDYAYGGPKARSRGFIMATMSSMACLGVALCNSVLFPY